MNVFLWILQFFLAIMFLLAGIFKTTLPIDRLRPKLRWVDDYSVGTVRFIGIAEILGAIGLVLPALTHILPILTPMAAVALAVVMVLAVRVHLRRGEKSGAAYNIVFLVPLLMVIWGRFGEWAIS
ncbi:MAG: DoxX family protein [Acidobacteria bacterium]|nr:DoxX family protein [Acidobacteriota bacterium]